MTDPPRSRKRKSPDEPFLFDPRPWTDDALCAEIDPGLFTPEWRGASARPAKAICAQCPVSTECLAYGLAIGDDWSIYGGTTAWERRQMKRRAS